MNQPRIIWQAPDGSIAVSIPCSPVRDGETETAYLERVAARVKNATPSLAAHQMVAVVEASTLPSRRFRNAWRWVAGAITPDLGKAKALLEAEIPLRTKASPAKVARIRSGITTSTSVVALEAVAVAEGWKTPLVVASAGDAGEDI